MSFDAAWWVLSINVWFDMISTTLTPTALIHQIYNINSSYLFDWFTWMSVPITIHTSLDPAQRDLVFLLLILLIAYEIKQIYSIRHIASLLPILSLMTHTKNIFKCHKVDYDIFTQRWLQSMVGNITTIQRAKWKIQKDRDNIIATWNQLNLPKRNGQ